MSTIVKFAFIFLFWFTGNKQTLEPLAWDFVGKNLFAMAVEGVFFFIFTVLLQYKFFIHFKYTGFFISFTEILLWMVNSWYFKVCFFPPRLWSEPVLPPLGSEDEDVAHERERVKSNKTREDILTVRDLSKVCNPNAKIRMSLQWTRRIFKLAKWWHEVLIYFISKCKYLEASNSTFLSNVN